MLTQEETAMKRKQLMGSIIVAGSFSLAVLIAKAQAGDLTYYLTNGAVAGNGPVTACDKGYHMASLWEVLNISTLTYDARRGFTSEDSGSGPPAAEFGWIRTGNVAGNDSTHISGTIAGKANCKAWATAASNTNGTAVELFDIWRTPSDQIGTPATITSPWAATIFSCDTALPVWCIQDDENN
jgi:hypothetical protein